MITVAVCDTEPIAIEGLRSLLDSTEGLRVVATESSLADGIDAARELSPNILLADKMFGTHAVMDCPKALQRLNIRTSVVIWGPAMPDVEALRFLQAGATGVIRKTARLDLLLTCLRQVANGTTWMEGELGREPGRPVLRAPSPLTARELEVMELL